MDRTDQLLVPGYGEPVGHAGDEIADRAQLLDAAAAIMPRRRKSRRVIAIGCREVGDHAFGFVTNKLEFARTVKAIVEEALELALLLGQRRGKACELATGRADLVERFDPRFGDPTHGL